ncbi:acyltransferase family protein [Kumtagia ephedrae]|uniref:Acyltransferase n=1 Tax=Kumtagia ephedrae TaxID=2116701 RepID=A0A2P7S077_9HYPH|nr:acyltransferase family protein [Mesorhizobium ephedrae]PSJ55843.1 acyltransferase [Mesorhizobium ephedrae]
MREGAPSPGRLGTLERLDYRADIDGLRALAVLPVVFFHAGVAGFSGGFVGVDVFFVISGYLMAVLIAGEIDRGEFSLVRFYERRIRRIFPALFAMIAACAVMAWLFFMPDEFSLFARSVRGAALFVSNIRFEREMGYFDIASEMKPLLHTWSLAVEEQFYIVFPLVLMAIARFVPRRVVPILLALLLASLIASAWMVHDDPEAAFYLAQFRAWELLLGALLAFNAVPRPGGAMARQLMAAIGVALIGLAVFTFSEDTVFPGLSALVPCVGAALVIHARASGGPAGLLLAARPLVFVGLISYSLYLWHWPIVVFTNYLFGPDPSLARSGLIVAASLAAAVVSWRFVERPFRGSASRVARRPLFAGATAVMAASAVFAYVVVAGDGLPGRLPPAAAKVYSAVHDNGRFSSAECFLESDGDGLSLEDIRAGKLCRVGLPGPNPRFLVWGDSHSAAMAPAIDASAVQAGVGGLFVGTGGCPPLPDVRLSKVRDIERCRDYNQAVLDLIESMRIPEVIMVAYWPKYVHGAELPNQGVYFDPSVPPPVEDRSAPIAEAMDRVLARLTERGTKVVLVMDVPEMGYFVPEALARAAITGGSTDIAPSWAYTEKRQALARKMLQDFAAKYSATAVDPLPAFCSDGRCHAERDGVPLYTDSDHITATAARSLSHLYQPVMQRIREAETADD